MLMNLSQDT